MSSKKDTTDERPGPFYRNYDYGGPEDASDSGPGRGLYNGNMDKYDSVSDFLAKKRKKRRQVRKAAYKKFLGLD